jgi:hypothetical protein
MEDNSAESAGRSTNNPFVDSGITDPADDDGMMARQAAPADEELAAADLDGVTGGGVTSVIRKVTDTGSDFARVGPGNSFNPNVEFGQIDDFGFQQRQFNDLPRGGGGMNDDLSSQNDSLFRDDNSGGGRANELSDGASDYMADHTEGDLLNDADRWEPGRPNSVRSSDPDYQAFLGEQNQRDGILPGVDPDFKSMKDSELEFEMSGDMNAERARFLDPKPEVVPDFHGAPHDNPTTFHTRAADDAVPDANGANTASDTSTRDAALAAAAAAGVVTLTTLVATETIPPPR